MSDVILTNRLMGNTFINSAVLEVISNYGSDITITNSTLNIEKTCTSLDSHILSIDITKSVYYFIIPSSLYGVYTVTADNNGNSDTKEITINNNQKYIIELYYYDYIYKAGEEYNSITNGWYCTGAGLGTGTKYADHMFLRGKFVGGQDWGSGGCRTQTMINISEYKKIYVNLENFYTNLTSSASTSFDIALLKAANTINNQTGFGSSNVTRILEYSGSAVNRPATCTLEASLTSYTGNYYIGIESIGRSSDHIIQFDVINIYLEK